MSKTVSAMYTLLKDLQVKLNTAYQKSDRGECQKQKYFFFIFYETMLKPCFSFIMAHHMANYLIYVFTYRISLLQRWECVRLLPLQQGFVTYVLSGWRLLSFHGCKRKTINFLHLRINKCCYKSLQTLKQWNMLMNRNCTQINLKILGNVIVNLPRYIE